MDDERGADRVKIDLDPDTALRALLAVDPDSEPADQDDKSAQPDKRDDDAAPADS